MIRNILCFAILLVVLITCAPVQGTTYFDKEMSCPVCGTKDTYRVIGSYGGYIYSWDSRFQYIFWPLIDDQSLYACRKCHFTCLMWDFEKVPKGKISDLRKALKDTTLSPPDKKRLEKMSSSRATYQLTPIAERIVIAEKVYKVLGQNDEEWSRFYRMAGNYYDEAGMKKEAESVRKKALEYAGLLIADKKNADRLKELYLISGAMRHFLKDYEGATKDFKKGREAPYKDSTLGKEDEKEKRKYLDELLKEFLDSPGAQIDICLAVNAESLSKVKELLDGEPGLIKTRYKTGDTLLHRAVYMDNTALAELLIMRGADIDAKNKKGETPLKAALGSDPKSKMVELLRKCKARE